MMLPIRFTLLLIWLEIIMAFPSLSPIGTRTASLPKLVLLDRDGVINHDVGAPGVTKPDQFRLTDGAATAIGTLKRHGCIVVLVTNQSCVGKGLISRSQLDDIHDMMVQQLLEEDADAILDRLYICTTTNPIEDARRKPNPGMMLEAMEDFQVDTADCVLIGDTLTDLQAATAAKIPLRILVSTGYGAGIMGRDASGSESEYVTEVDVPSSFPESILPFQYVTNLASAVEHLVAGRRK